MLFSLWRLRKFRAFFSVGAENILFCFVCFFSNWNSRTCGFAYLFLKSFTFACGWEELSVIVRVTFSYVFVVVVCLFVCFRCVLFCLFFFSSTILYY